MGIVNPGTSVLYTDIPADVLEKIEDVVLNRRPDAAERLIELAESLKANMNETAGTAGCQARCLERRNCSGTFEVCFDERNRRFSGTGLGRGIASL